MTRAAPLPDEFAWAPFSVARATERGIRPHRLRARDLAAPFRGVRSGSAPATLAEWCDAYAPRLGEHQLFSHATAAGLWGLPLPTGHPLPLHVAATAGREPRAAGVVGHRVDAARIVPRRVRGLPAVSAADAWCQVAGSLSHRDLVAAGDRLLGWPHPLVAEEVLDEAIARHAGGRGAIARRNARRDIRRGAASRRETLLRLDVIAAGLPEPECNGRIELAPGLVVFGDLVFRRWRVLLEYDGDHHRTDARQFARDVDRLNALAAHGWIVVRARSGIATAHAIADAARALRSRGWRPA
ncbi:hypothetical protein ACGGZK_04630 [Agromyces sp. MMS24-K17]|uniref:hypothetical protein n=1 Tax=Agromyces sp. MMS24-K17 TaxID=3372850 RepID=UPI0037543F44